ncbi:MAG: aminotransferase class III-fold pyridoxal phosphate-dependent enzyme, partial [Blastocatellia bacterium]
MPAREIAVSGIHSPSIVDRPQSDATPASANGSVSGTSEALTAPIGSVMAGPLPQLSNNNSIGSLERFLTEQNRAMTQLMTQQLELLRQAVGNGVVNQMSVPPQTPTPANLAAPPQPHSEARQSETGPKAGMPWGHSAERRTRGMNPRQQQHIESLIARYTARTRKSKEMTAASRAVLADSRATVGFRFSTKELLYPIAGAGSDGARIWDVDGNEYIDFTMGFGVHLFGHQPGFINQAILEEFKRGVELGPRSEWAGEVAELFCQLTGLERAAFSNTGTEAVMTAIRLARAATGRDKVVIFNNSYHGHSDGTLARPAIVNGMAGAAPLTPGVPIGVAENVIVLDYCSDEALDVITA